MRRIQQVRTATKVKSAVALAVLATVTLGVTAAFGASSTPTPTIVSGPNSPTTSTSTTFTYSDGSTAVNFTCSLDGAAFTACGTGTATTNGSVTYTGLAEGAHTFKVVAQAKGSSASAPASRTWSVDRSAPQVALTFPMVGAAYNSGGWSAGCSTTGLCGTATDPSGVTSVRLAVAQFSTGKYWDGSSFSSSSTVYRPATGTTTWSFPLPFSALSDGVYVVLMAATDALGNATPALNPSVSAFRIDTVAPPAPSISKSPDNPTPDSSATFKFDDSEQGVSFRCQADGSAFAPCSSGVTYAGLAPGDHCFAVLAVDSAGNASAANKYCWTIAPKGTFPIKGDVTQSMAPGVTRPIDLTFTNPNNFDIQVTGVTITVQDATKKNGNPNPACVGSQNLTVTRPFTGPVTVPGNSSKSLSQLGVPAGQWPLITMPNLATNQDACKSTTFALTYSGTATK